MTCCMIWLGLMYRCRCGSILWKRERQLHERYHDLRAGILDGVFPS